MAKAKKEASKATATTNLEPNIKTIKRKIHYYEIEFDFDKSFDSSGAINKDPFNAFFSIIAVMARDKDPLRYQPIYDAKVFVQDVVFDEKGEFIKGKLRYVKTDVFPELLNMIEDTTRDIDALEAEGIVETSHFMIDMSREKKFLILEYNHAGAKFSDFIKYCELIGQAKGIMETIDERHYRTIVRDEISTFERRLKMISGFYMKIHKNNIDEVKALNNELGTALDQTESLFDFEYIELNLKFKVKQGQPTQKQNSIRGFAMNLINSIREDREKINKYDILKIRAQDTEKGLKMNLFDLLADKVSSEISVQLKPKKKVLVSEDMFDKMWKEYKLKNII